MMKICSRLKNENEETGNSLSYFPKKNLNKIQRNFSCNISNFEKTLYEENYLKIISQENIEIQLLKDENELLIDDSVFCSDTLFVQNKFIQQLEEYNIMINWGAKDVHNKWYKL